MSVPDLRLDQSRLGHERLPTSAYHRPSTSKIKFAWENRRESLGLVHPMVDAKIENAKKEARGKSIVIRLQELDKRDQRIIYGRYCNSSR
jgi:hypothetical protein